ncbi:MAG: phosphatase PAP2 family protein [Ramlibacter sp.]
MKPHWFRPQLTFVKARFSRLGPLGLRLTVSVLLFIAATWLFAGIAEDVVTGDPLVLADQQITEWFHAHATPGITRWMLLVTHAHGTLGISLMGLALALYLTWRRIWSWLLTLAVALPGGMVLNVIFKHIFRRTRPSFDDPLLTLLSYSFPSGHVTGSALLYGVLASFLASRVKTWFARMLIFAGACLMVIAVGTTRIYLGVHYFSDVVAAAAWSTAWLVMWLTAADLFWRRFSAV